jgi:hypothetical protein
LYTEIPPHPTPPTWTAFSPLFYCLNKNQIKKVKRGKWADKLKKNKTKFKILSSPLALSLSKFTDSLSLSLSLFLSGTPSSRPVGHPSSPDSVSTGRHLSLSRPYFTGEKHSLSSPQPTIPLHRQGPFSTGKVAFPSFFFNRSTTFFFLFIYFFPFSVFLTEVTTFFFLFLFFFSLFCFFNRSHDLLLPLFFFCFFNRRHDLLLPFFLKKNKKMAMVEFIILPLRI